MTLSDSITLESERSNGRRNGEMEKWGKEGLRLTFNFTTSAFNCLYSHLIFANFQAKGNYYDGSGGPREPEGFQLAPFFRIFQH